MRKILLSILIIGLLTGYVNAETCTFDNNSGGGDGAWHTATNWDCSVSGEKIPAADDAVVLSAAVTWVPASGTRIPATSGRLGTITASGAYGITIDVDTGNTTCDVEDACAIFFTTATANTETLFSITGTSAAAFLTIDGTSCTASADTSNKNCISLTGANTVNADVLPIGSSGSTGDGINMSGAGDVYASKGATGGGASTAHGIHNAGTSAAVVTVTAGTITGGSVQAANGVSNPNAAASNIVLSSGVLLVDGTLGSAMYGSFTWNATAGSNSSWKAGGIWVSPAPAKTKVTSDQSIVIYNSGEYEAGTATSGGGGAWAY